MEALGQEQACAGAGVRGINHDLLIIAINHDL